MKDVHVKNNFGKVSKAMLRNGKTSFDTVSTDVKRVSAGAAPKKTGFLEKNHLNVEYNRDKWVAHIYFKATNRGFDYADWTHEAHYNLGKRSRQKPGGNSRFTGHVPVGRKYLENTVEQGRNSYQDHIIDKIIESTK